MNKVSGGCHCGNITVDLELTAEPETYHPRVCDCDFCRKHGAASLSDTKGSTGTAGHVHAESVVTRARNTQLANSHADRGEQRRSRHPGRLRRLCELRY